MRYNRVLVAKVPIFTPIAVFFSIAYIGTSIDFSQSILDFVLLYRVVVYGAGPNLLFDLCTTVTVNKRVGRDYFFCKILCM